MDVLNGGKTYEWLMRGWMDNIWGDRMGAECMNKAGWMIYRWMAGWML